MKRIKPKRRDIYLPHIDYTVRIRDLRHFRGGEILGLAFVQEDSKDQCTIYLPSKGVTAPTFAHEMVHVLQYMCGARYMDFMQESEHLAYTAQYLMAKAMDYVWV